MSDPDLQTRVQQFNALELPGQPQGMHMGTSYLVNDLWREVFRLKSEIRQCALELEEASKIIAAVHPRAATLFADAAKRATGVLGDATPSAERRED